MYTSGFVDDVISAHKPMLLDVAAHVKCSCTRSLGLGYEMCALIPVAGQRMHGTTSRALKVTSQVATQGAKSVPPEDEHSAVAAALRKAVTSHWKRRCHRSLGHRDGHVSTFYNPTRPTRQL